MKQLKKHLTGILLCLFEMIVGVLVLIDPMGFIKGILAAAVIILMLIGLVWVIQYCRLEPKPAAKGQFLLKGQLALSAGCFCAFRAEWLLLTFPAFTFLLGVAVFVAGLVKVQLAMDMARVGNKRWFLGLIGAVVSLVCAVVILKEPFKTAEVLWAFTGVSLIVEAVVDAAMLIISNSPAKEKPKAPATAKSEAPEEENNT